jgi:cellulose synthase/poly-beta-1,6-N-acetylglucosamine synthase-like glycosyltransferase
MWLLYVIFVAYLLLVVVFTIAWLRKQPIAERSEEKKTEMWATVVVVFRNEEKTLPFLLQDLENQSLEKTLWEVIFINDFSDDNGKIFLENYQCTSPLNIRIFDNDHLSHILSPKKRGISYAVSQAKGDLIVCTDADCRLGEHWLTSICNFQQSTQAAFISSPVRFAPIQSMFEALQALEFASLIGSGAACIRLKSPTMCNGANIAYPKTVFEEVKGFEGSEQIASGDDEFLMHKIAQKYPHQVFFLQSQEAIVSTFPNRNVQSLFQQRKRWASKWEHYQSMPAKMLAVFIFLANLLTLILAVSLFFMEHRIIIWSLLGLKFCVEFVFLAVILSFLRQKYLWVQIPILFVLYPFYVVFFALISRKKSYIWKGRKHQHQYSKQ